MWFGENCGFYRVEIVLVFCGSAENKIVRAYVFVNDDVLRENLEISFLPRAHTSVFAPNLCIQAL